MRQQRWSIYVFVSLLKVIFAQIDYTTCGITKDCFCQAKECQMSASWAPSTAGTIEIELWGNAMALGNYVAIGFSKDQKMGADFVTECSSYGSQPLSGKLSFNAPYSRPISNFTTVERDSILTPITIAGSNGQLYCKLRQKIKPDINSPYVGNLNQNFYVFLAMGKTNTDGLLRHTIRTIYPKMLNPTSPIGPVVQTTTTKNPNSLKDFDKSTCGQSKGCFMFPNGCDPIDDCSAAVSYRRLDNDYVELELSGMATGVTNNYVAVGFSQDQNMPKTPVTECSSMNGNGPSGKLSYNDNGRANTRITEFNETQMNAILITDTAIETNGRIYCKLRQKINPGLTTEKIANLTQDFYLLMAVGVTDGGLLTHHVHRTFSTALINPLSNQTATSPINFDSTECGKSKGCYMLPDSCDPMTNCVAAVSYRKFNDELVELELMGKTTSNSPGNYIALGFSQDQDMPETPVTECSSIVGAVASGKLSYNQQYNTRITDTNQATMDAILKTQFVREADGLIYCKLRQKIDPGVIPSKKIVNLNQTFFLLMAVGVTNTTGLTMHYDKTFSASRISPLSNVSATTNAASAPPPTGPSQIQFNVTECDILKGCFRMPSDDCDPMTTCSAAVSYRKYDNEWVELELLAKSSGTGRSYVALGFSRDRAMPSTPVTECSFMNGDTVPRGRLSYNPASPKTNARISEMSQDQMDLIVTTDFSQEANGLIYCRLRQKINPAISSDKVVSLNQSFILLMAYGPTSGAGLSYHGGGKTMSSIEVSPMSTESVSAQPKTKKLYMAHGILMIIAWLVIFPTAIISARLMRDHWPQHKPMGLHVWFHLHRSLNLLGICCTIASAVCIAIASDWSWKGPGSDEEFGTKIHTMMGLVALILAWFQPIGALTRPKPSAEYRAMFNWAHRLAGLIAVSLAAATIFIAAYDFDWFWVKKTINLVVALVPVAILLILLPLTISGPLANVSPVTAQRVIEVAHDDNPNVVQLLHYNNGKHTVNGNVGAVWSNEPVEKPSGGILYFKWFLATGAFFAFLACAIIIALNVLNATEDPDADIN